MHSLIRMRVDSPFELFALVVVKIREFKIPFIGGLSDQPYGCGYKMMIKLGCYNLNIPCRKVAAYCISLHEK